MLLTVFAGNFRGFQKIKMEVKNLSFLVGQNSSGKSSILHLLSAIGDSDLERIPSFYEDIAVDSFDFFSPYFEYSDVDLGYLQDFSEDDDGSFYGKVLTISKSKSLGRPYVKKVTWSHSKHGIICLFSRGKGYQYLIDLEKPVNNIDELQEFHRNTARGFKKIRNSKSRGHVLSTVDMIMELINGDESKKIVDLATRIASHPELPVVRHFGPVRGMPEKFYEFKRKIQISGKHFATMWYDLKLGVSDEEREIIQKFGKESGLFEDIHIHPVSKSMQDSPLFIEVQISGHKFLINQVGVGVSQIVPILIELLWSRRSFGNMIILVQQPELHLHPVAQAALGDLIFTMVRSGARCVLETHSDFIIDRVRRRSREAEDFDPKSCNLLFFQNSQKGNYVKEIKIDNEGQYIDPPNEYREFFMSEILENLA